MGRLTGRNLSCKGILVRGRGSRFGQEGAGMGLLQWRMVGRSGRGSCFGKGLKKGSLEHLEPLEHLERLKWRLVFSNFSCSFSSFPQSPPCSPSLSKSLSFLFPATPLKHSSPLSPFLFSDSRSCSRCISTTKSFLSSLFLIVSSLMFWSWLSLCSCCGASLGGGLRGRVCVGLGSAVAKFWGFGAVRGICGRVEVFGAVGVGLGELDRSGREGMGEEILRGLGSGFVGFLGVDFFRGSGVCFGDFLSSFSCE
ncbi:unnamed protein product [Moneuplotes crassus]|uniref:Uncharacterized protein n=1 Tax=Euplotes crassus TaxID=5936 RepID=A0AAD1UKV6_EUPCR|nr:unnamed protein product [Moneuplotes crassus]